MVIDRSLLKDVRAALSSVPVIALLGSRQTGKTTLAKTLQAMLEDRQTIYLDLELDSDRVAMNNAEFFLEQHKTKLVIIDEIQRLPSLFPLLRAMVDRFRQPGRFLILGSASPSLLRRSAESLAGRIRYFEVPPFHIPEISYQDMQVLWLRGGYPESFLSINDVESLRWRQDFLTTFLERDIPTLGIRIPATQLRRCWTMLAHQQSQPWNALQYGNNLGLSAPTVKHYLDTLTDTFMVRMLPPYFVNVGKRLIKAPKTIIRDSGLVHALLGIQTMDQLLSHPVVGHSWEAFVIETVIRSLPVDWQFFFYRTNAGAEMDLVLQSPAGSRFGIEIKFGLNPAPTKGFYNSARDLGTLRNFLIYPGEHRVPLDDSTELLPLGQLITEILPKLD
jgi:predicted AAA+ superfamily ATPase